MRRFVVAVVMAVAAPVAHAADLPDWAAAPVLRGGLSSSLTNWQGAYIGGQLGYSGSNQDFSEATKSLTDSLLQNLSINSTVSGFTVLGKDSSTSVGFGGFVGWNSQWDDVILGVEANYSRLSNLGASSFNSTPFINIPAGCVAPPTPGDIDVCSAKVDGSASAKLTDVLTLRGRAGWTIDNYMPYMFAGLAVGRADISRSVTITQQDEFFTPQPAPAPPVANGPPVFTVFNKAESTNAYTYGWAAGFGLEAMLYGNFFARGEYEYVGFVTTKGIDINVNTVRGAVGYKF